MPTICQPYDQTLYGDTELYCSGLGLPVPLPDAAGPGDCIPKPYDTSLYGDGETYCSGQGGQQTQILYGDVLVRRLSVRVRYNQGSLRIDAIRPQAMIRPSRRHDA